MDTIAPNDNGVQQNDLRLHRHDAEALSQALSVLSGTIGYPPVDPSLTTQFVAYYFRCWHPLYPFLDSPNLLLDVTSLYRDLNKLSKHSGSMKKAQAVRGPQNVIAGLFGFRKVPIWFILQVLINIAALGNTNIQLPEGSRIKSSTALVQCIRTINLGNGGDPSIFQAFLAVEIFIVATNCVIDASLVANSTQRLWRNARTSSALLGSSMTTEFGSEMLKKISWCIRILEWHITTLLTYKAHYHHIQGQCNDNQLSIEIDHSNNQVHGLLEEVVGDSDSMTINRSECLSMSRLPMALFIAYIQYFRLGAQNVAVYSKTPKALSKFFRRNFLMQASKIEEWWNNLPSQLNNDEVLNIGNLHAMEEENAKRKWQDFSNFFRILYHDLLLSLHSPCLFLHKERAAEDDFHYSLHQCLKSSRTILKALHRYRASGKPTYLPLLGDVGFRSGLIVGLAGCLGKYPTLRAEW